MGHEVKKHLHALSVLSFSGEIWYREKAWPGGSIVFLGIDNKRGGNAISFNSKIDQKEIDRQKQKARKLRQSPWWQRKISKGICHYCGQSFAARDLTMDHIVPLTRGGKSTKGNLVPACKDCNNKKKYLLPIEWEEYLQGLAHKQS
jgi:5-methylcytosine-specific restriction protein A